MIKVKLTNEKEVEKLKTINRHAYDILMKEIIDNDGCPFKDKGVQVIALPRNVDSIPEWLLPFVDYNTIVNDNISRFYSVLESLGVETMKAGKMQYYSNILKI
jgi:hypothetical protein